MNKIFQSLLSVLLLGAVAFGQTPDTEIFLKGIQNPETSGGFRTVDMDHDEDGNTYVLGERSGTGVIVKYDTAGGRQTIATLTTDLVIPGFLPVAFDVVGGESDGSIFVASSRVVYKYSLATGTGVQTGSVGFADIKDLVFASATNKLMVGVEGPNYPPIVMVLNGGGTTFENWMIFEEAGWSGTNRATLRSMTADDLGNVYVVGETASSVPAAPSNGWTPAGPTAVSGQATLTGGTRYLAKLNANLAEYSIKQPADFTNLFDVTYRNGWVYLMGKASSPADSLRVQRLDTSLIRSKDFTITNPDYGTLVRATPGNMKKFSLSADALDNIFITGYTKSGTTKFIDSALDEFQSVASTAESAFVAKLDYNFEYKWVKTPIQSPIPPLGDHLKVAWDGTNSRLWWAGTYNRTSDLSMQEGSDASTRKTLGKTVSSITGWAGFVAVFEPEGVFTETALFTLETDFFTENVQFNDQPVITNLPVRRDLILDSIVTIKTPRTIYQSGGSKTDDVPPNDELIVEAADTRYSFLNFSVNNVVQDSNATTYTFALQQPTRIKLEWLVEYALQVNANFDNTLSSAKNPDNSRYVEKLTSLASGNPIPSVGAHWYAKDSKANLEINGAVEDLGAHPGLGVRYVPWRYRRTGAAGSSDGFFSSMQPRQHIAEFTMTGPATVTYDWKLQYGVDMKSTNLSADALLLVEYVSDPPTPTLPQTDSEGGGVHWYDDGTVVRIAAPKALSFSGGPQALQGWINGDNQIFNPAEDSFSPELANPFTAAQVNSGFLEFPRGGDDFIGRQVKLNRPARVVWDYGDSVILKTVGIGNAVEFTAAEISDFGLNVGSRPALSSEGVDPSNATSPNVATNSDFIWDDVAKKFFPVRPVDMNLLWPTASGNPARVLLTPVWGSINYRHVASSPPVSLISHPPVSQPNDLVFQKVAYASADAAVDDQVQFTASQSGRAVLEFKRITPSGRGGTAQSVVEIKVVETKLWNANLGATVNAVIGRKITSPKDLAGLGTGYVFFGNARYNSYVYDRSVFAGEALWDSGSPAGPVIPVNQNPSASANTNDELVVVWYDDPALNDHFLWPYSAVRYNPQWPANAAQGLGRILMSSGFGSESVGADGNDQNVIGDIVVNGQTISAATTLDPARFEQALIYSQPDRSQPGYNPNEEHALLAPSKRFETVAPRPLAAYAMRENDLNIITRNSSYTSDPYVLVQFLDKADNEFKMKVYQVTRQDLVHYPNGFSSEMKAGEAVIPFYPLDVVSGATLCSSNYAREGDPSRLTYWKDHKSTAWAVSGGGAFSAYFFYPLSPDFWWPDATKVVGDCVAWLPNASTDRGRVSFTEINYTMPDQTPAAQGVAYTTVWPLTLPTLKVGETLTYAGGEYAADNPGNPGLPGVLAWSAGEVVFDDLNPDMREGSFNPDGKTFENSTARMISALEQRTVSLPVAQFPQALLPATGRTKVDGTIYLFEELSSSLKKRVFYNPLNGTLGIKGILNDKDIGNDTLTAAPPAVYVLEPNIFTQSEYEELLGTGDGSPFADISGDSNWRGAVDALFKLSRNPNQLADSRVISGGNYTAGLQSKSTFDPNTGQVAVDNTAAEAYQAMGPGLALVSNPAFLNPFDATLPDVSYVTLAENNDPSLGGSPVILHVIKVDRRERYRGAIKVVLSDNVFDENIILRHTGDFGAKADDLVFDWWYRVEDGTEALPPDAIPAGQTNPWKVFPDPSDNQGRGFYQLKLKGNPQAPELLLADSLWFVRYRHKNETPDDPVSWAASPTIPFDWAGAGNSTPNDLDGDGLPDYQAQLAQGWVKRVLDAVNPYEARIRDFTGDSPATYASMIRQFGQRYEGAVALNPDKNVIENVGLIELYSTILNRARSLSIDHSSHVSTPGITNALLLASTRLADFYMLLGNEAYTDAQDSTIGYGSDSAEYGNLAPTVFTFQNQLSSQIEEELALLRGVYDFKAKPVYNRLFWNFTKGEGEAAYATSYNISDVNQDGFINEDDAMILFPQGHGDAWGHYLTAIGGQYGLLNNPYFNWVSRSELYSLQDIVFEVDFLDERKFAQVAAAKAKAGAEIVELTYRESYVADPESQWQGYLDTDPKRAWGVEGWARRAGQGAYFDWVTANALLPSVHPNSSKTGIEKVDRTTVKDIAVISANMNAVQQTFEDANNGYNPLGIAGNTVPFDIDPFYDGVSWERETHFEQIYQRAVDALNNALAVFNNANELQNMVRRIENNEVDFRRSVFEQDMAYRNELIEIFGSPYDGTIGSGAAYPAGYDGPDTSLYMYVDKQTREITARTVPGITSGFDNDLNNIDDNFPDFIGTDFRVNYAPSFQSNNPADWFSNFGGVNYIMTADNGITFDSGNARVGLSNMNLPIKASGYTFEALESWGQRSSPGALQLQIAAMIQQEAELAKAIAAWDGFQGGVVRQLRLIAAQAEMDDDIRALMGGKIANNTILGLASIALNSGAGVIDIGIELASGIVEGTSEFTPGNLPTAGFSFSPGDLLSTLRGAVKLAGEGIEGTMRAMKLVLEQSAAASDLTKDLIDMGLDFEIDDDERDFAMKQALVELENMVGDEGILRVEVFSQLEALRAKSEEYRAMLQKGARLIDEREAYNKRVAELVQRNRYQDMSFRVSRNAALQQYHEAFNVAARYAYLAGKAYDYETNLHPDDAGSARGVLTNIVSARGLGLVSDGEPQLGNGGLAEQLAKLKANFSVLKGQLGLNNPQNEAGRFSLRKELYRIAPEETSNPTWRDQLAAKKVDNLWSMPEFRRYCRPFAAYDPATPEPGIVIEFSSEIIAGKNFFGQALAGGDNAYDPTNFATKMSSVGVWFEGYVSDSFSTGLSETPRVYLVPAGTDIMSYPSDTDLGVRMWNVLDQKIPVPFPVLETNLDDSGWRPLDTLGGTEGEIRKFSSFRAYPDSGSFLQEEMTFDSRLVGRSVWNTRWMLIIPGKTLKADPEAGLETFIDNVTDIKLFFQTFGYSGN